MSTLVVCLLVVALVLFDLLAVRFGSDTRSDACQLPERWVGNR
jgi:hypothetical protein